MQRVALLGFALVTGSLFRAMIEWQKFRFSFFKNLAMSTENPRILIVDDDKALVTLLVDYLSLEGFVTESAGDGAQALAKLAQSRFDLVILDVMMPGMTGTEVLARIREKYDTPVLMLTGKGDSIDRIVGLELGADDYVPKPCPPRELVARMRAVLRRVMSPKKEKPSLVTVGPLTIDTVHRKTTVQGKELTLTGTEMALLQMLAENVGKPVAKSDIYATVLRRAMGRFDRTVDVHVSALRKKLAAAAPDCFCIENIRGIGYQFIFNEPSAP